MSCEVCGRLYHPQRLPFLCAVDARNHLYEPRIAHAVALLQNEQLEAQVNAGLGVESGIPGTEGDAGDDSKERKAAPKSQAEAWKAERQEALDHARDMADRAGRLRSEMAAARLALNRRKEGLQQRRSDLAAASNGTAARRARLQAEAERSIAMTRFKWNKSYEAMAATRGFLCMEASKLYGLRRLKKGSTVRYEIGGFEVVDPYNMNNLPPEVVSTSLAHIAHILMLACHYLSIRLPAEITLPHRDYPRPTIFSLSSSYTHGDVPFPGTANLHPNIPSSSGSSPSSASSRRSSSHKIPRARPLYLDKPLHVLAKEDSHGHTLFLEGIALLAYNVAWACCSQGVPIGDKASFEDTFSIGRNLYNLLIGNQLLNNPVGRIFPASAAVSPSNSSQGPEGNGSSGGKNSSSSNKNENQPENENENENGNAGGKTPTVPASIGRYSHGTTHTYLGDDTVQGFKLLNPNRLADRLKTKLSSESTMPDWEVLEDDAWAVEDEDQNNMEDGVLNRVVVSPPAVRQNGRGSKNHRGTSLGGGIRDSGSGSGSNKSGGAAAGGGVVVGSRVPEQRLFGVESVATVFTAMDDTLADIDPESQRPSGRVPADRAKGSGTSGWTKLRNRQ
ncbi:hypothetical protein SCUCBS95973_004569 [Sporothrix curviconia]|uniref:Autophagy-related protein 14 n=1 Tax=Sporothrix curviconia TaxID=1260050 RepID=A0ABP0BRA8_9PEZI